MKTTVHTMHDNVSKRTAGPEKLGIRMYNLECLRSTSVATDLYVLCGPVVPLPLSQGFCLDTLTIPN